MLKAILLIGTLFLLASNPAHAKESGVAAECVHWKAEARFQGLGFNHFVHLDNQCKHAMRCEVKTDVNPNSTTVELAPNTKKTIKTFNGSPAAKFVAKVSCRRS
jgi:hypothetical protein